MITELGSPQQVFTLEVRLTTKCNYNCYYCTDLHNNKNPITLLSSTNVCLLIQSITKIIKLPIHLFIYGGEPTIYPHIDGFINDILEYITSNKLSVFVELQTNLSRDSKWITSFCERYKIYNEIFSVSCSFHNTESKILSFVKKCLILKKYNLLHKVTFMYNKRECVMPDFNTGISILGTKYCEVSPLIDSKTSQVVSDVTELQHIQSREKIDKLAEHSFFFKKNIECKDDQKGEHYTSRFELWLHNKNTFHGYACRVAMERLVIDWDGNCYKCFNEMFADVPPVFNINAIVDYDEYFSNVKIVVCPFAKCFFDLEHKKTKQLAGIESIPITVNAIYGTNSYRKKN